MKATNQIAVAELQPTTNATEIQSFGSIADRPISLDHKVRRAGSNALNALLADTMSIRDLYKKHHWQVSGHTFYQLHLLYDKHYAEQAALVDTIAERIQTLGGVSIAMAADVADATRITRPPMGREDPTIQLFRLFGFIPFCGKAMTRRSQFMLFSRITMELVHGPFWSKNWANMCTP